MIAPIFAFLAFINVAFLSIFVEAVVIDRSPMRSPLGSTASSPRRPIITPFSGSRSFTAHVQSLASSNGAHSDPGRYSLSDPRYYEQFDGQRFSEPLCLFNNDGAISPPPKLIWRTDTKEHVYFEGFARQENVYFAECFAAFKFYACPSDLGLNATAIRDEDFLLSNGCLLIPQRSYPLEVASINGEVGWSVSTMFEVSKMKDQVDFEITELLSIVAVSPFSFSGIAYMRSPPVKIVEHQEHKVAGFEYIDDDSLEHARIASSFDPNTAQDAIEILRPYSNEEKGVTLKADKMLTEVDTDLFGMMEDDDVFDDWIIKDNTKQRIIEAKSILLSL